MWPEEKKNIIEKKFEVEKFVKANKFTLILGNVKVTDVSNVVWKEVNVCKEKRIKMTFKSF